MNKFYRLGLSAAVATAVFGLVAVSANAQTATPAPAPKTAPPAAAPAAKTVPPAAAAPKAAPKAADKAASPCKGLDETACKANTACGWTVPTKANAKTGKVQSPYCHKIAVKKPAATTAPAPAAKAPAAPTAPKAPATAPVTK